MELYADDNTVVNVLLISFSFVINRCIADRIVNNIKVLVGWPVYGHSSVLHILYTTSCLVTAFINNDNVNSRYETIVLSSI